MAMRLMSRLDEAPVRRLRRRSGVAGAVLVLLVGVLATAAPADNTSVSDFSKVGTNETNGSSTAGGATGTAEEGDRINWVLSYRNKTGATADVDITDPITGNHSYVSGSLKTPPGLDPQWSTDGGSTWAGTDPGSGVNGVGATGTSVDGSTGLHDLFNPPQESFSAGRSEGDGWEALFVGPEVWNVHHHRPAGDAIQTMLDCHVKATGASCAGFPAAGHYVSENAGEAFSTGADTLITPPYTNGAVADGRLYFPVGRDSSTSIGVLCADTTTRTSCGYTELAQAAHPNSGGFFAGIAGGAHIGNKLYVVGISAGAPVYCYDLTTEAECGDWPDNGVPSDPTYDATANMPSWALESYGGYLFPSVWRPSGGESLRDLGCVVVATAAPCPGFPKLGVQTNLKASWAGVAPILNDGGGVTGICAQTGTDSLSTEYRCWDPATGGSMGTPLFDQMVPSAGVGAGNIGAALQIGTRLYFHYVGPGSNGPVTYTCYDFATDSACQGFVPVSGGTGIRPYTLRQDPDNPDCIWELGDAGIFQVFSATFGGSTACKVGNAQVEVTPAAFYCDGQDGHVQGWDELRVRGVAASGYDALAVTITDADGNAVPGWTNRVFASSDPPIDISSIPYSGSTTTLKVQVVISWGSHPVDPDAAIEVTFDGDAPQLCFETEVGTADCFDTLTIGNQANAVTQVPGGPSDAPDGNSTETAAFSQTADPLPCDDAAPACALTNQGRDRFMRPFLEVTVRDTVSGVASIEVLEIKNGSVSMPSFSPGTTDPLVVRANGNSSVKPVSMTIQVTDVAGNVTVCDPVAFVVVRDENRPVKMTFEDIPAVEHFVHVSNGDPGVDAVTMRVNGHDKYKLKQLEDNESTTVDVQDSMRDDDENTIEFTVRGKPGSSALIVISDS